MIKAMEAADGQSCWNKAAKDEMVFVLLGRDAAAPAAIRAWIAERIRLGKNKLGDHQIINAENCAQYMEIKQKA